MQHGWATAMQGRSMSRVMLMRRTTLKQETSGRAGSQGDQQHRLQPTPTPNSHQFRSPLLLLLHRINLPTLHLRRSSTHLSFDLRTRTAHLLLTAQCPMPGRLEHQLSLLQLSAPPQVAPPTTNSISRSSTLIPTLHRPTARQATAASRPRAAAREGERAISCASQTEESSGSTLRLHRRSVKAPVPHTLPAQRAARVIRQQGAREA